MHSRALNTLKKTFFGGGTVEMLSPSRDYHVLRNSFHERYSTLRVYLTSFKFVVYCIFQFLHIGVHFIIKSQHFSLRNCLNIETKFFLIYRFEDGTSNFLAIISLGTGLREFKV